MKITIPKWVEEEDENRAFLCNSVNAVLKKYPNMTLEEFAKRLDEKIQFDSVIRVQRALDEQFELGGGVYAEDE